MLDADTKVSSVSNPELIINLECIFVESHFTNEPVGFLQANNTILTNLERFSDLFDATKNDLFLKFKLNSNFCDLLDA